MKKRIAMIKLLHHTFCIRENKSRGLKTVLNNGLMLVEYVVYCLVAICQTILFAKETLVGTEEVWHEILVGHPCTQHIFPICLVNFDQYIAEFHLL